jgi:glyoxylase I family protein
MTITGIQHVSFIVASVEQSLAFYRDLLGLQQDPSRPDLGYPGAWLTVGDQQIHLLELENPDPVVNRPWHVGQDRHVALMISGLAELRARLEEAEIIYTSSRSGRQAIFCRDPDGNGLEFIQA